MTTDEWITPKQIAARYQRSVGTIWGWSRTTLWRDGVRRRQVSPHPGFAYHAGEVDRVIRTWVWLPPTNSTIAPDELLTVRQIADYSGLRFNLVHKSTLVPESDFWLGPPEKTINGINWWRRSTVDAIFLGREIWKSRSRT